MPRPLLFLLRPQGSCKKTLGGMALMTAQQQLQERNARRPPSPFFLSYLVIARFLYYIVGDESFESKRPKSMDTEIRKRLYERSIHAHSSALFIINSRLARACEPCETIIPCLSVRRLVWSV